MMYELTLSPMYGVLLSSYLKKVSSLNAEAGAASSLTLSDVNDSSAYTSRMSQSDIETLIKEIASFTEDMSFGLDIGMSVHPSDYGTVGYTLMNCSSLHQAFDYAAHHKHASNKGFGITFFKQANLYHFCIDSLVKSEYLQAIIEFDFASALYLSRFFVGIEKAKKVIPQSVSFTHMPQGSLDKYREVFGCEVKFNQSVNEIVFSKAVFEIPIRSANPKLFKLMGGKVAKRKKEMEQNLSLKQKIYQYIFENIENGLPSIEGVASEFNMGVSSFKKHLNNEHTNYTQIMDEVRRDMALKLILDASKSILQIANSLGFANSSAFNRAFKRWLNMTPAAYRKKGLPNNYHSNATFLVP